MENYYIKEYKNKIAAMTKDELKLEWAKVINELKKSKMKDIPIAPLKARTTASGRTF